jgi:beta-lactamase class A
MKAFYRVPRVVHTIVLSLALWTTAGRAVQASPLGPLADLQLSLTTMAETAPGEVGIAVEDIPTGHRLDVHGSANMPAASVIKIPVMVEAFRQMQLGTLDLNERVTLQAHDRDWGWGDLADAHVGTTYTINRLLRLMITESDNTATNMLIRRIGLRNINTTMKNLALPNTVLGEDIRSDGNIRSLRTSPNDMIVLLDAMAHERLINAWSSREMLAILAGQQHNGLIPVPLPRGLEIAHKTGTLHDTLNDVGIVFLNGDPYAIAVMTTRLPDLDLGRTFIRNVSRVAYESFTRRPAPLQPLDTLEADGLMSDDGKLSPDPKTIIPEDTTMPHTPDRTSTVPAPRAVTEPSAADKAREDDLSVAHMATTDALPAGPSDIDQAVNLPTDVPQSADVQMWASQRKH